MRPDKLEYAEWAQGIEADPRFVAEMLKLEFAEELVKMLKARGLKRTELAEKLGTHRGYITRVLNTDYNLTIETMAKVAVALDARIKLELVPNDKPAKAKPPRQTTARTRSKTRPRSEFIAADGPKSG